MNHEHAVAEVTRQAAQAAALAEELRAETRGLRQHSDNAEWRGPAADRMRSCADDLVLAADGVARDLDDLAQMLRAHARQAGAAGAQLQVALAGARNVLEHTARGMASAHQLPGW